MSQVMMPDVLTLEEVAAYLRIPKEMIQQEAARGRIPGRQLDDSWRFLKAAIDDWLRSRDSRMILLQQAGALAPMKRYLNCGPRFTASAGALSVKKPQTHNAPARDRYAHLSACWPWTGRPALARA